MDENDATPSIRSTDVPESRSDTTCTECGEGLPRELVNEVVQLTKRAHAAISEAETAAYRNDRDEKLATYNYTARVREEDSGSVLVLYPEEWTEADTIQVDRIQNTERAIERRLTGPGTDDEFVEVDERNREIVSAVEAKTDSVHAENAAAFADFMGNHYVRRIDTAREPELVEFIEEYFKRNAFPSEAQKSALEESLRVVFEVCDRDPLPIIDDESAT